MLSAVIQRGCADADADEKVDCILYLMYVVSVLQ
jgi:hypothetical protein